MPLLAVLLLCLSSPADSLGAFEGSLVERDGTPLEFANVIVLGTHRGALVDSTGHFRVSRIPPGRWIVRYTLLGYDAVQDTLDFIAGSTLYRKRVMTQNLPPMKEVCPCADHPLWKPPI